MCELCEFYLVLDEIPIIRKKWTKAIYDTYHTQTELRNKWILNDNTTLRTYGLNTLPATTMAYIVSRYSIESAAGVICSSWSMEYMGKNQMK